jgi:hypothetical protein
MGSLRAGWKRWGVLIVAVLGAVCGSFAAKQPARACSCVEDRWSVSLRSVESDAVDVSHEPYWPTEGDLSGYRGHASIWFSSSSPGQVSRVEAGQW